MPGEKVPSSHPNAGYINFDPYYYRNLLDKKYHPKATWMHLYKQIQYEYYRDFDTFYEIDPVTGCWNWLQQFDRNGKPITNFPTFNPGFQAVDITYSIKVGNIPWHHKRRHPCNNSKCVNPDHWQFLTKEDIDLEKEAKADKIKEKATEKTIKEIAAEENMTYQAVYNLTKGELTTKKYKVPESEYPKIAEKVKAGMVAQKLAYEYKVSYATMYNIIQKIKKSV